MQINPYLNFDGDCKAAFEFYQEVFGGEITFQMTWGEMPGAEQFPPETHSRIMHCTLSVGNTQLMGADTPGPYVAPKGLNLSIHVKDTAEGQRVFDALAQGGSVVMPFEKTFWSPGFGMCVDKFGIPWMINTEGVPTP